MNEWRAAHLELRAGAFDIDVAEEAATQSKNQVLAQAGTSVLSQANQAPQQALSLLKG